MCHSQSVGVPVCSDPEQQSPAVRPPEGSLPLHVELAKQLDGIPSDLGVMLLVFGALGVVIPGPVPPGFSFLLLGTIALRPSLLARSGAPLARRFPRVFRVLIGLLTHYRADLDQRYPGSMPEYHEPRP